jgi:transposase
LTRDAILLCSFRVGSLIETAKLHDIDPQAWLTHVLGRIADHKITKLDELMPWRYAQD